MDNKKNQLRAFNSLEFVDNKTKIIKRSTYVTKFLDEINWFINAPENLKKYTPAVDDYSLDEKNPWIKYELIKFPTVHDLIFDQNKKVNWDLVVKQYINFILECLKNKPAHYDEQVWYNNLVNFYFDKTIDRLKEVVKDSNLDFFNNNKYIIVNDKKYLSVKGILLSLELQKKLAIEKKIPDNTWKVIFDNIKSRICYIHGDPCFSNVFAGELFEQFKVIDPRGSFGHDKKYGDIFYDLAKISHSANGLYDFIIQDLFTIEFKDNHVNYKIEKNDKIDKLIDNNYFVLFDKYFNLKTIRFIESLLFLSMVPLHKDHPERQKVFLAHGIKMFWDFLI